MSWQDKILQPDNPVEQMKQKAALRALEFVESGMKLGLGTGSTARFFVDGLGAKLTDGLSDIVCVPTSEATREQAESLNIRLAPLDELQRLDITVDGADELDDALRLIKGGGGALLREKIVAAASKKFVCIADESKLVGRLGKFPLPVEVIPMARSLVAREIIKKIGGEPVLREGFTTDNGNIILDIHNLDIMDPVETEQVLNNITGVVTNGLFAMRPADVLLLGTPDGVKVVE